jgi:hypothetical protein
MAQGLKWISGFNCWTGRAQHAGGAERGGLQRSKVEGGTHQVRRPFAYDIHIVCRLVTSSIGKEASKVVEPRHDSNGIPVDPSLLVMCSHAALERVQRHADVLPLQQAGEVVGHHVHVAPRAHAAPRYAEVHTCHV